ncbi:transcription antitermination factor NusB [Candidatus Roizmanbacteria bacterium CG22_combo_CG10-13_8_21_14_all_35_9]|uniref:Transcription antitermination factor NusB n=2 Tax=Candidatus Roizmaniibacteriota TaxID=1752723 RepID=A0A2M8F2F4_9BACT|nr:MAG: transcription antitermination factor NusB [Candidatus Roizmanbacteria bacterium CG22_combo_CG10-13_8_21_14_all_35_9]PJC33474.1 MAG: transcription antitermination factor NusB [Candidatus Roizmanbacteria bacterium CG_4_9_14_0_2_um_filter_35_15]PJC82496.1 MAG: transcription antitermination factor NusB [Candidatus Roizmanbacteria bacterium CG_4_8_14_3_um_filter_35_14]
MDIRHQERISIVQELFAFFFNKKTKLSEKTKKILENQDKINLLVEKNAPKFPLEKIAKIDLAILTLAVFELILEKKQPPKVIINEAVEIAKEFGGDKSYAFINAVLGKIYVK